MQEPRPIHKLLCAAGLCCLAVSTAYAAQVNLPGLGDPDLVPTGKGWGEFSEFAPDRVEVPLLLHGELKAAATYGINYHGGPVMLGTTPVYIIWYGNWSGNTATSLIPTFVNGLNGSAYQNINTTYYNSAAQHVSNALNVAGQASDTAYTYGKALSDAAIKSIVSAKCNTAAMGNCANNAIYAVLTSADVNATSGFCTQYCGWHTHGSINGKDVKYAFVGNPDRCIASCAAQKTGPNGNAGADGLVSILTHEISETLSDPDLNAWYDKGGNENADKCAWNFGTTSTASNGAKYNVTLGGKQWLVQQNWANVAPSGKCAISYP